MLIGVAYHVRPLSEMYVAHIASPRQESPIGNGLYEDLETGKLYPELIVSDFKNLLILVELTQPYS